ncbi:uncharacterized protein LOC135928491 isoform X2 [Gordionus sp. m RMFG-2023]|uniref:uncharacterized protein LOC135928491 isoform X2 n=1 Tax=Gordionus sp. m RMFG-2023 TaxID=3053472 RepID=UPI0031FE3AD0
MGESSEDWLDKQKRKLQELKDASTNGHNGGYLTSSTTYKNIGGNKGRDSRRLVEELKTKQHTWKQEKTEKTTERVDDDTSQEQHSRTPEIRRVYRIRGSPTRQPPQERETQRRREVEYESKTRHESDDSSRGGGGVTLHPIQISTLREDGGSNSTFKEAKYFSETKRVETVQDGSGGGYRKMTTSTSGRPINGWRESGLSDYSTSRSQGYNTLTSEEDFYDNDSRCHTFREGDTSGGRLRSKSFAADLDHYNKYNNNLETSIFRRAGTGHEYSAGDVRPSGTAAEVFREAARHLAPDGEVVYTSRRYDTRRQNKELVIPPRVPSPVHIAHHHHHHGYDGGDGDILVTETYKRTREVRTDGADGGTSVVQVQHSAPPPLPIMQDFGRGQEEYGYKRRVYESELLPPATATSIIPVRQEFNTQQRSHSAASHLDDRFVPVHNQDAPRTLYYRKTTSYEDDDQVPTRHSSYNNQQRIQSHQSQQQQQQQEQQRSHQQLQSQQQHREEFRYNTASDQRYNQDGFNKYDRSGGGQPHFDSRQNTDNF